VAWNRHYYRIKGNRHYELTNHLGNVLAVVTDRKLGQDTTVNATYTPQYYLPDIYSVQNYYAFGQNLPQWSSSALNDPKRYRFGFNGKEDEDEWTKQDYGFRMYDPRVARFLSVDPLASKFPWNSPFSFAENDVIRSIDLDGAEKVAVNSLSSPVVGTPGKAKITISLDYHIVSTGRGAVSIPVNPADIEKLFQKGNRTLYLSSLPSKAGPATLLSSKHEKWAAKSESTNPKVAAKHSQKLKDAGIAYYSAQVEYQYHYSMGADLTSEVGWMQGDKQSRGVIFEPFAKSLFMPTDDATMYNVNFNSSKVYAKDPDIGGFSTNESVYGVIDNFITHNPRTTLKLPLEEIFAHESGHNSARNNIHSNSQYKYNQEGLQSNQRGSIFPTKQNTIEIINDSSNH
jgi:RHS repeat-associated protein